METDTFGAEGKHGRLKQAAVQKYIQNQEKEDMISAQIGMVEYYDPFKEWLESWSKRTK